ncbi:MAG: hypothetical protein QNJ81_10920 [Acidimicrobiia bacterium]|nr:hypothetical protein [Acidimicrobiia bacterium]
MFEYPEQLLAKASDTPSDLEIAALCMAIARDPELDLSCKEGVELWLDGLNDSAQALELRQRLGLNGVAV